jgi:hypothetical protein
MASRKEIPSRLANCRIPKCQSCCLYAEKLPSVLGELRDSQVPSRRSPYQANAFQWIHLSHQWLGLLDRTKDSSFASAIRLQQSLWTTSAGCHMFTSKSQQKGCKLWLPRDLLKLIPVPMESRSNNTMPTIGDSLSTYSSITVRNRVRRYPYVESVHTSKMALLKEGSRISLKGPERPYYTQFIGGPQQSPGRNTMSLQGTRSSQPFGLSNESVASTHGQCTSTRLGSTFMGGNKPMESTIGKLSLQWSTGSLSGLLWSYH